MSVNLKGKDFLTLKDYSKEEINHLLNLASSLKKDKKSGKINTNLLGKNIALIFEKPSTRTRCAFSVACADEGGHSEYLNSNDIQLGYKESIHDTARVLSRMFDGIEFRGFKHKSVTDLAKYSDVPVWNGLTDDYHPTQILADLLTIKEHFGKLDGIKFAYLGDGRNNMANSLMIGASKMSMDFRIISPKELFPNADLVKECQDYAQASGAKIQIGDSISELIKDVDVVYTDVWCSMGEEAKSEDRIKLLKPFQVNKKLMDSAKKSAIFMHCLPAVKGYEVTEEVFEANANVIFDEAENRLHTIKAVMVATI